MINRSLGVGRFALTLHVGGIGLLWGLLAVLVSRGALSVGVAVAFGASTTLLALLVLFALASLKRQIAALARQSRGQSARVGTELGALEGRLATRIRKETFDPYRYWEDRAARMGAPAVGDVSWSDADWDDETKYDLETVLPAFVKRFPAPTRRVLDFGCGVGRFTSTLATHAEEGAIGCDATASLLAIAERDKTSEKASFQQVRGGLPFPDGHFDAVWVSYVFIHVLGEAKRDLARELDRVLAPGGALCIIEGVNTWRTGSPHCEFVGLDWYREAFPYGLEAFERVSFEALDDGALGAMLEAREKTNEDLHLVMLGRKPA